MVIDLQARRLGPQLSAKRFEVAKVLRPYLPGVQQHLLRGPLQAAELTHAVERKLHLLRREHVKQQDLLATVPEAPKRLEKLRQWREAVREDDNQAAAMKLARDLLPKRCQAALGPRLALLEHLKK